MPGVIKLVKAQMSNIIQSGRFIGAFFGKLAGPLMVFVWCFFTNFYLAPLPTMASTSAIVDAIQRKMCESKAEAKRAGKGIILFILHEDIDDIIRVIKSLQNSGILNNGVSKTLKHEIKNFFVL